MVIKTPLKMGTEADVSVQGILDQIVPGVIPLGLTFIVYFLVRRNVKTTYLLLGLLALGFIGSIMNVFS